MHYHFSATNVWEGKTFDCSWWLSEDERLHIWILIRGSWLPAVRQIGADGWLGGEEGDTKSPSQPLSSFSVSPLLSYGWKVRSSFLLQSHFPISIFVLAVENLIEIKMRSPEFASNFWCLSPLRLFASPPPTSDWIDNSLSLQRGKIAKCSDIDFTTKYYSSW